MTEIRTFIAIHLSDSVQSELSKVQNNLKGQMPPDSVRWVKPEQIHLTLRFLGATAVSQLPHLVTALDAITLQHEPFTLQLSNLGCFPNQKRPRVIWAGIEGNLQAARALKAEIETAVAELGWEKDARSFRPHLTIGRVKESRQLQAIRWGSEINELEIPVSAVHLIESQLTRSGPIYTVRHSSHLGNPA